MCTLKCMVCKVYMVVYMNKSMAFWMVEFEIFWSENRMTEGTSRGCAFRLAPPVGNGQ